MLACRENYLCSVRYNSHTTVAALTHASDSQLGPDSKRPKAKRQLVFSQLICQSGPQTSDHITVNVPDKSRHGEWGGGQDSSPITLTSPWAENSDVPDHFAQDPGSPSYEGRASCQSSRNDVTWLLCC